MIDGKIYKITNKINGKIYVGQTIKSLEERFKSHDTKNSRCSLLKKAFKKYGKNNFKIEPICRALSKTSLDKKEKYWIRKLQSKVPNGYNLTDGGEGTIGYKFSPYYRKYILKPLRKSEWESIEKRKKQSKVLKKYFSIKEHRERLKNNLLLWHKNNPQAGKKHSKKLKEYWSDPEKRKKMSSIKKQLQSKPSWRGKQSLRLKFFYEKNPTAILEMSRKAKIRCSSTKWRRSQSLRIKRMHKLNPNIRLNQANKISKSFILYRGDTKICGKNAAKFCRDKNIYRSAIGRVLHYKLKSYKGYTAVPASKLDKWWKKQKELNKKNN